MLSREPAGWRVGYATPGALGAAWRVSAWLDALAAIGSTQGELLVVLEDRRRRLGGRSANVWGTPDRTAIMTDNVENLVLEHLRAMRADFSRMERKLDEAVTRLGRLEVAVAGLRRDMAHTDEGAAEQSVRIDHLAERLDRIERRLELREQA